jgi:hypothetical protein
MSRITLCMLTAALAVHWSAAAVAESASSKSSSNSTTKSATTSNTSAPAQRINNIVNYNTVNVKQNPGPVNRIAPTGTQAMTPNAQSKYGGGLRTNPVPSPANPNARYNSQGRNINPTGDKKIAAGFDANQKRYQATQSKPATTTSTNRSWPGPTRPTTPAVSRSTSTASAVVSRLGPPPPPPSRSYSTASSSSTATSSSNKKP